MVVGLKPVLLALLAAVLLHVLGLAGVGSQLRTASALTPARDPLFTRTIEAASPAAEPAAPTPAEPPPAKAAVASPAAAPSLPLASETVAQAPPPEPGPPPPPPVPQPAPTPPPAPEPSIVQATVTAPLVSPSQVLTAQPAGQTDTLLITGEWPADTRVSYKLAGFFQGELHGSGQVQWTREGPAGERYQVRVIVDAGLVDMTMTSQGKVSPQGLLPEVYEEVTRRVLAKPRVRTLQLEAQELVLDDKRRVPRPAKEPNAVQDTVSQFIDLGHRLQQGRGKLAEGEVIRIWLGRPGGLDEWIYDVGPEESVTLPRIGSVRVHALKPRPLANPRGTITLSMWLAPSLQYLPAKIRIQLNAEAYVELLADRLQQR